MDGDFQAAYEPTIEESYQKSMTLPEDSVGPQDLFEKGKGQWQHSSKTLGGGSLDIEVLDTAGTEQYTALRDLYIKSGDAFMLVYAVDSLSSFHELDALFKRIKRIKGPEVIIDALFHCNGNIFYVLGQDSYITGWQ